LLAAFGGGFTWGGAYLTWAYDGAKAAKLNGHAKTNGGVSAR
jgi:3-oxoacyl-[acyl-carrier-protein] synthase-3